MFAWLSGFFANPALLAGASAGSIPIIIHLLNKQRFKKILWAAMHWLWAAQKKSSRRLRIEQLILLLIRILILVLLALALARPALQEGMGLLAGRASIHRVIVLDNSYSMGHLVGGKPLYDKAKDLAIQLVEKLHPSDDVDVLLMNSSTEELASNAVKISEVVRDIKASKLSDEGTHVLRGIAAACEKIERRGSKNIRREIIVITDQTRAGWESGTQPKKLTASEEEHLLKLFDDNKTKPKIWVARLSGGGSRENIAALSLSVEEKVSIAKAETQLTAAFKNFGVTSVSKVPVVLYVDGEKVGREEIPLLEPQKTESVIFRQVFPDAGSHAVWVSLEADNLPVDNTCYLAQDVEEQVKVLCVDGQQRIGPNASELDFFRQALSPSRAEEVNAGRMPLFPEVISDGAFPDANLDNYRLIVLANVALIPAEKIEALKQYVLRGGSVWFWLGERIDPTIYNKDLGALLPVVLGDAVGTGDPEGASEALSDKEVSHPAVARFHDIKGLPLSQLKSFRRFTLKPKDTKNSEGRDAARMVLAYENGDSAAVEFKYGAGRVLLIGTTADKGWCDWPGKRHYMPLVNFLALDLIQPAYIFRNRMVGEIFEYHLPKQEISAARRDGLKLLDPTNEPLAMDIRTETFSAVSKPSRRAGIYSTEVTGEKKRVIHFAANRNSEESDLDTIDDKEILAYLPAEPGGSVERARFFDAARVSREDFELVAGEDFAQIESALKKHSSGKEIWRWLVMAVLMLLIAESLLAQRFGHFSK